MLLEQFERDAEAFSAALARERYLHYAGLRPELDTATIYERYPDLASAEAFRRLRDQPLDPRMLALLLGFVATNVLERGTRALGEQLAVEEAASTIEWLGRQVD